MSVNDQELHLEAINRADEASAARMLVPFIERAPEIARRVARHRPFSGPDALAGAVEREILALDAQALIALFQGHPELSPPAPRLMTGESQREQGRIGLTATPADRAEKLGRLNRRYSEKFGFPFIIALHRHPDIDTVVEIFERRLTARREDEIATARAEILSVSRARIFAALAPETGLSA
jgi:2-oxo-4-hydroxy-4-carboxy-5-ureidoimidazoline decarboxylase